MTHTVDTHCHTAADWYEPVDALLAAMDRAGVERAWLIQLLGVWDNHYQQAARAAHPDRFDNVVGVDWSAPDAIAELIRLTDEGARGVRLRPISRSPGDDPLAIWRTAQRLGLVVSCVGTAAQFADPSFGEVLTAVPGVPVILEHFGGLARPDAGDVELAKSGIFALARHPLVSLKLPGLGQIQPRQMLSPPPASVPLIDEAMAAFGADRLLWGSDFPVVSSREGYSNALKWSRNVVPELHRDAIFGGNAMRTIADLS